MKVLIDARVLTDNPTGLGRYAENLIHSYCSTYGKQNVIVLIHPGLTNRLSEVEYVETSLSATNILHFFILPFVLNKYSFDIYHASFYSGVPWLKKRVFYIVTIHDLIYREVKRYFFKNWFLNKLAVIYFDLLVWLSIRSADLLISVSQTTAADVLKGFGKKSVVIQEGFNTLRPGQKQEDVETFFKRHGIKKNGYFLYVGNLKLHKNVEFMVEAFLRSVTDKELLLCGYYKTIPSYLKKSPRIKFTGFVEDSLLPHIYANASAFVFPSQYEGFGFPVLEALDYGCKVFSSRGGALVEFPEESIHFFDLNNYNSLVSLLDRADELPPRSTDITALREFYNWETAMAKMQEIISGYLRSGTKA